MRRNGRCGSPWALFRFWETREHLAEGREQLGRVLKLAAATTSLRQRALFAAGVLAGEQGDYVVSDTLFYESLELGRRLEDKQGIAVALNGLAVNARDRGDLESSRILFEESLARWRELQDSPAVARALSNLASIVKSQENFKHAHALYEECLSIFRGVGDEAGRELGAQPSGRCGARPG